MLEWSPLEKVKQSGYATPTRSALDLHTARANYQVKIWLHADQEDVVAASPVDTAA